VKRLEIDGNGGFEVKLVAGRAFAHGARPDTGGRKVAVIFHPVTQEPDIDFRVILAKVFKETDSYLGRLSRAANEGRAVDEANNFLRWLQFSGVLMLLEKYSSIDEKFLTLRKTSGDLQDICKPHLQGRNIKDNPNLSRIDELNNKVDIILAAMAKSAKPAVVVEPIKQIGQGVCHE